MKSGQIKQWSLTCICFCSITYIVKLENFLFIIYAEPQTSICGNGVVEPGEECDCGWEEDCKDKCCYPQRRYPPVDETPCRLTPNARCSPSQVHFPFNLSLQKLTDYLFWNFVLGMPMYQIIQGDPKVA